MFLRAILFVFFLTCTLTANADPCVIKADNKLTILSNNVGIFPKSMTLFYKDSLKKKKRHIITDEVQRAKLLAKAFLEFEGDADIFCLQEIWSIKARDVLKTEFKDKYPYCKHPQSTGVKGLSSQPSGLMIFSKYSAEQFPIQNIFKRCWRRQTFTKGNHRGKSRKGWQESCDLYNSSASRRQRSISKNPVNCRNAMNLFANMPAMTM